MLLAEVWLVNEPMMPPMREPKPEEDDVEELEELEDDEEPPRAELNTLPSTLLELVLLEELEVVPIPPHAESRSAPPNRGTAKNFVCFICV